MKLLYAFPEPLPLPRARGIQATNAVAALALAGIDVDFCFVPSDLGDPFSQYQGGKPDKVTLAPLSRSLAWPLQRVHSNRLFAARLAKKFDLGAQLIMVRHLKLAAWLANQPNKPQFIYEAHEVFADTAPKTSIAARRNEEAAVMRAAAAVVANSAATANRLVSLYGQPKVLEVIPNGVFRPKSIPEKNWADIASRIIYSGSLFPWKGAADLVAAAAFLPGCKLEIVGGEPERLAEVKAMAPSQGATIEFLGHLPHQQALEHVMGACIAVLPNRADTDSAYTSPIKLFEYMAAGCAIVASDLPPMREILAEDEAMWAQPGNAASIAEAIKSLIREPARAARLGEIGREKSKQYTWQARAAKLCALMSKLGAAK
ncbi:MAG: glycosyltransferase family 4 protein [Burkholderiales bacterium]